MDADGDADHVLFRDDLPPPPADDDRGGVDPRADELDGVRVRQIAALRRGAYRVRSYCVVAAAALVVVAVQLCVMAVAFVRAAGWGARPVGYVMFAGFALLAAGYFARRVLHLTRELRQSAVPTPPDREPDFSTLSDGSQRWRNLEDVR